MNRKVCILALALLLIPASAFAADMNYTFVESGWLNSDADNLGSGDGPALGVSWSLTNMVHLVGRYNDVDFDNVPLVGDVGLTTFGFGAGVHHSLLDNLDLVGELAYIDMDVDAPGADSESGYQICAGVRMQVAERFEIEGGLEHMDAGDSDTLLTADARWNFNERWAFGAGYKIGDNDTFFIGARFNFGQR